MIVKFCGFTSLADIEKVKSLDIDMVGFIHYKNSKRYVSVGEIKKLMLQLPKHIDKIVVVVNPTMSTIDQLVNETDLTTIQLHGEESVECVQYIRKRYSHVKIIKAISATSYKNIKSKVAFYQNYVDLFIIDTPSKHYGGSGKSFDWNILNELNDTPFLIAGGINEDKIKLIEEMHLSHAGYDIASGIETKGCKDKNKMIKIIEQVKGVK
ncbi:phosphoribosylanthranilate isomerase [Staphylococcus sp. SQ8-PEA]|uniref:N-(5'-phosphoribosyl)anthranilate isomerase n=1 Tax=Staphylococcus marylandisciuri TaxID=2981529 RepID=A0ABT2QNK3_9STAP|nr:phosphoribosylanthranilate isomerase [Staphylococcus marylandisciuri]MCU5745563.1 phosphoribosylanthranilate isomerase [Staphylococcus marylandisciuri]